MNDTTRICIIIYRGQPIFWVKTKAEAKIAIEEYAKFLSRGKEGFAVEELDLFYFSKGIHENESASGTNND